MPEHECYMYIVASRSRSLYIGMTSRLQACIADHQNGTFEGFSKDYRCTRLVYFERCTGPTGAILREKPAVPRRVRAKLLVEAVTRGDIALANS